MTIYFDNCLSNCKEAVLELPDGTSISNVLDACTAKWSYGSLLRLRGRGELIWRHDPDANWIGCCADKIGRLASPPAEAAK